MENLQLQMQQLMVDQQTIFLQQTQRQQNSNVTVKLPQLDMPTYNGDRLKWTEFWDTFETTIDQNGSLSEVEKSKYLNSKLTGEAKLAVSGILLSNENYKVAVDILKERFGDQQTVVNSHYAELINLSSANNTTRSLRFLYDQIEKNLRSLNALKQDINQDIFVSLVTAKVPRDVLIQLEIQKGSKIKWTVSKMKILGFTWIMRTDQMVINVHTGADTESILTKRAVLKQIASAFDPLGLFSPVILRGKIFLQHLWNQNLSWDETLSSQDVIQWLDIEEDIHKLKSSTFQRYIGFMQQEKCTYHLLAFSDASKSAYATYVYLYQECGKLRKVDLVFSKTRLAPNKDIGIPRLELLAAVIGTRCIRFVQKELKLDICSKHIWLDSQCVLCWIDSQKSLSKFVENR